MAVPVPGRACRPLARALAGEPWPFIPVSPQGGVQLRLQKLFDEAPNALADPSFHGIEPIAAQKMLVVR